MDNSDPVARRLLPRLGRHEKPNSIPGLVLATATALSLVHIACGDAVSPPDPPPPEPARPAAIAVVSGNNQSSHGDESLPDPIVVGVRDQYGNLMSGIAVTFIPQSGHGRTDPSASTTDAEGRASTQWTLGNFAGQQVLNVAVHNGPTATVHADALQPRPKASILTTTAMAAERDSLHFTIQLSDTVSDTIEIRYTIGGDGDGATADADSADYAGPPYGTIWIAAGSPTGILSVAITDDMEAEPAHEILIVTLDPSTSDSGHRLGSTVSATATIQEGVCDRSSWILNGLADMLPAVECWEVTPDNLASIEGSLDLRPATPSADTVRALRYGDLGGLHGIESLALSGNNLAELPPEVFDDLTSLRDLNLRHNRLVSLPPDLFRNLTALRWLNLAQNQLTRLPEAAFAGLTDLYSLSLGNNQLTAVPSDAFEGLSSLGRLELLHNKIPELPAGAFGSLTALRTLDLRLNRLGRLPEDAFAGLVKLERLALGGNRLTKLPAGLFTGLVALRYLNLGHNRLGELPSGAFQDLANLYHLDLYNNRLAMLPERAFVGLENLDELNLAENPGGPFQLSLEVIRIDTADALAPGPAKVALRIAEGVPFGFSIVVSVQRGDASATSMTMLAGSEQSDTISVQQDDNPGSPTHVSIGPPPRLPDGFDGDCSYVAGKKWRCVQLVAGESLVLFGRDSNSTPVATVELPRYRLRVGEVEANVALEEHFRDPDGDRLSYAAQTTDSSVATARIVGSHLHLVPVGAGSALVSVTGRDTGGLSANLEAEVRVGAQQTGYTIDVAVADGFSPSQIEAFENAAARWQEIVRHTSDSDVVSSGGVGRRCGTEPYERTPHRRFDQGWLRGGLLVQVGPGSDGQFGSGWHGRVGGHLAQMGVCRAVRTAYNGPPARPQIVNLEIDMADVAAWEEQGELATLATHVFGHALGFGIMWDDHGLLREANGDAHFAGPRAVSAFDAAGGNEYSGAKVPVETRREQFFLAGIHWRESVLGVELMTGVLTPGVLNPLSAITIASLADLGYHVDVSLAEGFNIGE